MSVEAYYAWKLRAKSTGRDGRAIGKIKQAQVI
jgi:hypothetical protein